VLKSPGIPKLQHGEAHRGLGYPRSVVSDFSKWAVGWMEVVSMCILSAGHTSDRPIHR